MTVLLLLSQLIGAPLAQPVERDPPFRAGEVLVYDARVSLIGRVGEAILRVEGGCRVGNRDALLLSFHVSGGAAFMRVSDKTRSWIDAATLATLRYEKRESSPLGSHDESATVFAAERRWQDEAGATFATSGDLSIDELSLLYYIRTLPLRPGDSELGAGHFDVQRNPVGLRVLGRKATEVPAGRFTVIEVQLKVRDPRRYRGTGTVTVQLTDDERRTPVRIRTSLPGTSAVTLELRSAGTSAPDLSSCREGNS